MVQPPSGRGSYAHELDLVDARHAYGAHRVLEGVTLRAEKGSFIAVLGESGSGKTTLLRIIAGFERLQSGTLALGGEVVDDGRRVVAPEKRRVGYVPQEGALFPHLRVEANVAFGLGRRARRSLAVQGLIEMVGLAGLEKRYPHELSGGQQQRVALARALAIEPDVVLLDEPFSSLDAALRATIRRDVAQILRERGTTTVLVTHDQDEALSMADRVAVLRAGRIVAEDRPETLYRSPVDASMAGFLGEANLLRGRARSGVVWTSLGSLVLQEEVAGGWDSASDSAVVLVRPEQLELWARGAVPASGGIPATILERAYFGHDAVLHVLPERSVTQGFEVHPLLVRMNGLDAPQPGAEVVMAVRGPVMAWPDAGGEATDLLPPGGRTTPRRCRYPSLRSTACRHADRS
jgi:iron(III) transport system ATP-binding protein